MGRSFFMLCSLVLLVPGAATAAECGDGIDNDGDGRIDRSDPDCRSALDDAEAAECNDGIDNDGNGLIDVWDPQCLVREQSCEGLIRCPPRRPHACDDGWDNEGDGLVDLADPECQGKPWTRSELHACEDGIDNDRDGFSDLADTECDALNSDAEHAACNDGVDSDGDGLVDFPHDDGCSDIFDDDERPACSDGLDNDGDGDVDLADSHCLVPGQRREAPRPDCRRGDPPGILLGALLPPGLAQARHKRR